MIQKNTIHASLILRLTTVSLILSALLAAFVLYNSRNELGVVVLDHFERGVEDFSYEARQYMEDPAMPDHAGLQRTLSEFMERGSGTRYGRSVYLVVHNQDGETVASHIDNEYRRIAAVKAYVANDGRDAIPDDRHYLMKRIGRHPHLYMKMPLYNSIDAEVGEIELMFTVSREIIVETNKRLARAILIGIGIVLLTTLCLYPIIVSLLKYQARLAISLLDSNLETLKVLGSAVAKRDSDTDIHNYRVTIYAVRLAQYISMERESIRALIKGAFLHDVGKVGIQDNILLKPGKLTKEEFKVMQLHVRHGLDIVERSAWLNDARDIVGHHHEKIDGTGYPTGLRGEEIPLPARIFCIADVFDALTSRRPYKDPFPFEKAMDILVEGKDSHFDGVLLDRFTEISQDLYDRFSGRDDDNVRDELDVIIDQYFSEDLASLSV